MGSGQGQTKRVKNTVSTSEDIVELPTYGTGEAWVKASGLDLSEITPKNSKEFELNTKDGKKTINIENISYSGSTDARYAVYKIQNTLIKKISSRDNNLNFDNFSKDFLEIMTSDSYTDLILPQAMFSLDKRKWREAITSGMVGVKSLSTSMARYYLGSPTAAKNLMLDDHEYILTQLMYDLFQHKGILIAPNYGGNVTMNDKEFNIENYKIKVTKDIEDFTYYTGRNYYTHYSKKFLLLMDKDDNILAAHNYYPRIQVKPSTRMIGNLNSYNDPVATISKLWTDAYYSFRTSNISKS